MNMSVATDYAADIGDPSPYLRRIADAGFTHIHWCHQWNTDFLYADCEIEQIGCWLREFGLRLLDLHASDGREKRWASPREYERQAGVELVRNRIDMTARLGADVIVMHIPAAPGNEALRQSLDELRPYARERGVCIAVENGVFDAIEWVLENYESDYVGLCYDAGHGNMIDDGLDRVEALKDRLIAVHLHDNDGAADQHKPLFSGILDWPRLAGIIAASAYAKPINMEVGIRNAGIEDEVAFLAHLVETGTRFADMVSAAVENSAIYGHGPIPGNGKTA